MKQQRRVYSEDWLAWADFEFKLERKVENKGECILWKGTIDRDGYGRIWFNGKLKTVHSLIYRLYLLDKQEIEKGMFIHHSCGHNHCVNTSHMYLSNSRREKATIDR